MGHETKIRLHGEKFLYVYTPIAIWHELPSIEVASQLAHINSDQCWCDPMVEVDESGREVVIHREVTWH